jgi:hypothetical protein
MGTPPGWGLEHRASNPVSVKNVTAIEPSTIVTLRPCVPVGTKRTSSSSSSSSSSNFLSYICILLSCIWYVATVLINFHLSTYIIIVFFLLAKFQRYNPKFCLLRISILGSDMNKNRFSTLVYLTLTSKLHPITRRENRGEKIWSTFTPQRKERAEND